MSEQGDRDREHHERISDLVARSLRRGMGDREAFLLEECAGDAGLLAEVRSLLSHLDRTGPLETGWLAAFPGAPFGEARPELEPGARFDDLQMIGRLGAGGMGEVWLARNHNTGGTVAVKIVPPDHVAREVKAVGKLHHPGIVQVHQTGVASDFAWISMEFVEGGRTLIDFVAEARRASEVGPLPEDYDRVVAEMVAKIAEALHAAHEAGVVHRDVKPGNVLLTPDGEPKVADFGLARNLDDPHQTRSVDSARTPSYCSPEQALGESAVDRATDVFSLGSVFYELLTMRRPFVGDTIEQVEQQVIHTDPPDPRTIRSRAPRDLVVICMACLEKEPVRRFRTMTDLAAELHRYLAHEPILRKPPGLGRRSLLWARRHPRAVVGLVLLLVVLVGGGLATAGFLQARRENQRFRITRYSVELDDIANEVTTLRPDPETWRPGWSERRAELSRWVETRTREVEIVDAETREALVALRTRALPRTPEELRHFETLREERLEPLDAWRDSLVRAARIASGEIPLNEPPFSPPDDDLGKVNVFAATRTGPADRPGRIWGEEAIGLAAARHVLGVVRSERRYRTRMAVALDTMAWALAWNGQLDEARACGREVLSHLRSRDLGDYELTVRRLEVLCDELVDGGKERLRQIAFERERRELENLRTTFDAWRFSESIDRFLFRTLVSLRLSLLNFVDPASGGLVVARRRLAWAERVRGLTAHHREGRPSWEDARQALRAADGKVASKRYATVPIDLQPQEGLVPIGMNPATGLWEFYHLRSARDLHAGKDIGDFPVPAQDPETGHVVVDDGTGIVFVLIPGGEYTVGTKERMDNEVRQTVSLEPFFMGRHELTQGQWKRFSTDGVNPSQFTKESWAPGQGRRPGLNNPVEQVNWDQADTLLRSHGLLLPTEAQWEVAARAGTTTRWSTGDDLESLEGKANVLDRTTGMAPFSGERVPWSDGYLSHAPVDAFLPNAFGLHCVHGNVAEWCRDWYASYDEVPARPGDGLRVVRPTAATNKANRGGSFRGDPKTTASGFRVMNDVASRFDLLGLRASRILVR